LANRSRKDEAQKQFKKVQRAEDGKKAMSEYESEAAATRAKTERLRALRLARDAAEKAASPSETTTKGAVSPKKRSAKAKKGPSGTLSDWLKNQQASGRRN
jgi:hypothetical protein